MYWQPTELVSSTDKLPISLVVCLPNNLGCRATKPRQGKAVLKSHSYSMGESTNKAMARLRGSPMAWLLASADGVVFSRRRVTMPSKKRLAANASSHAES